MRARRSKTSRPTIQIVTNLVRTAINVLEVVASTFPRRHVVIAGTGRAGTSFLVRFLGECGLDTGSPETGFDDRARAGLEHCLLDEDTPYVVKDAWFSVYCDRIDPQTVKVEALLVPIRELMAASTSRLLQERISMADNDWGKLPPSEVGGAVTGGAIYSLDPVDEARILAVGFHRVIHWAVIHQVPLFLLEYPRIVTDGEYLLDSLWPWLSAHCDKEQARAAFAATADPDLVRVGGSNDSIAKPEELDAGALDRAAMHFLLKEREAHLTSAKSRLAESERLRAEAEARLAEREERLEVIQERMGVTQHSLAEAEHRLAETETRLEINQKQIAETQRRLEECLANSEQNDLELQAMEARLATAAAEADALRGSFSWRVTRPLRWIRGSAPGSRLSGLTGKGPSAGSGPLRGSGSQ